MGVVEPENEDDPGREQRARERGGRRQKDGVSVVRRRKIKGCGRCVQRWRKQKYSAE